MKATLNISLDEKICPDVTTQRRYDIVRAALRLCFPDGLVGEIQPATYVGPDGPVHEHCGVFQVQFDASRPAFHEAIYCIARSLGQDCIAVVEDDGLGRCIGPRSSRWPFDPAHFHYPASHLAAEAA